MDQIKIGKFIAERRKERGLLQKDIAARLGISEKTVSKWECGNGRRFTVQHFYEGITYDYNEATENMQKESAALLARIHVAMKDMENIPIGIGRDFFIYRKPEYMKDSYTDTLQQAIDNGDTDIAAAIRSNMRIVEAIPSYEFDINKFSCGNTHGDYMISQLIWLDDKINGIIDWTCACKHPYIWEIVRSYVFMAPEVRQGELSIEALMRYIIDYMEFSPLNSYDIENAGKLFYYFLAVCNFYGQYYDSISENRYIYLRQHRTELVRKMRSQIFRQIVQKFRRQAGACQEISVQDDGKSASRLRAKPLGVLCAVLP